MRITLFALQSARLRQTTALALFVPALLTVALACNNQPDPTASSPITDPTPITAPSEEPARPGTLDPTLAPPAGSVPPPAPNPVATSGPASPSSAEPGSGPAPEAKEDTGQETTTGAVIETSTGEDNPVMPVVNQAAKQGFKSITSGGLYSCGLRHDGSVSCWAPAEGQGEGESLPFAEGETFTSISVGVFIICGLRTDGAPLCQSGPTDDSEEIPPHQETELLRPSAAV